MVTPDGVLKAVLDSEGVVIRRPEKSHNTLFQEDSSGGDLKREKGGGGGNRKGR